MNKAKVTWKVDMFDRVKLLCDTHIAIIQLVVALDAGYTIFKAMLVNVKNRMQLVTVEENGLADNKDKIWEELAKKLKSLTAALRAYAKDQRNMELRALAMFTPSAFTKERGTDAIALGTRLIDLLNTHVASLADYNVTPAKVTAASNLLAQLAAANPKPVAERTNLKVLRELLVKAVDETTVQLKDVIDELVNTLEEDEPEFVEQYFAARRIQHTGIRHEQTEEEAAARKLKREAKKQEEEAKKQEATQSKEAKQPEATSDEGQPDTNGASPPDDAPSGDEGQTEGEG